MSALRTWWPTLQTSQELRGVCNWLYRQREGTNWYYEVCADQGEDNTTRSRINIFIPPPPNSNIIGKFLLDSTIAQKPELTD